MHIALYLFSKHAKEAPDGGKPEFVLICLGVNEGPDGGAPASFLNYVVGVAAESLQVITSSQSASRFLLPRTKINHPALVAADSGSY
jgi:hypothetical protein